VLTSPAAAVERAGRHRASVIGRYRATRSNVFIMVGLGCAVWLATLDLADEDGGPMWSWRLLVVAVVGGAMLARAWRRGVVVTTAGIEVRRLWWSLRTPWSAVETCGMGHPQVGDVASRGTFTVFLVDGTVHRGAAGPGRRGDPELDDAVTLARDGEATGSSDHQDPNLLLTAFLAVGIALLVAMTVADTGRGNRDRAHREVYTYSAEELRDLEHEIAIADWLSAFLALAFGATGVLAVVDECLQRGVAPNTSWPAGLHYPTVPIGPFDETLTLEVDDDEIRDADGELVATVSRRAVPWTPTTVDIYWVARGVSDFAVHHVGSRWHLTSWHAPLDAWLQEHPARTEARLHIAGVCVGHVVARPPLGSLPTMYDVIGDDDVPFATLERSDTTLTCRFQPTSPTTRRLLCVAAMWVAHRHHSLAEG
jgi:hypothetical protein